MKKTRCDSMYRLIAALAFSLALPVSLTAQDLAVWFAKPDNTAVYGSIAAQVEPLGSSIKAASLSDSLLAKRLEEAVKKHISPSTLLPTLRSDTERALFVAKALYSRGLLSTDRKKATLAVEQITLLLRAGIDDIELEAVLDASAKKCGKNDSAVSRALAALSVAVTAEAKYKLSESDSLFLALGLVTSTLPEGKLNSILASVADLVKKGKPVSEALQSAIGKVSKGNAAEAIAAAAAFTTQKGKAEKPGNRENAGESGDKGSPANSGSKNNGTKTKGVGTGTD